MRNQEFGKASILFALKIMAGTAIVLAVMLNGTHLVSCPPNLFCLWSYEFYSMRLDLWTGVAALVGLCLLLSALKDIFERLGRIELLERNIESISLVNFPYSHIARDPIAELRWMKYYHPELLFNPDAFDG